MHQETKNPDAHCRLARGSGASFRALNNRRYMAGEEFEARQLWLDFSDAVGPALQAIGRAGYWQSCDEKQEGVLYLAEKFRAAGRCCYRPRHTA